MEGGVNVRADVDAGVDLGEVGGARSHDVTNATPLKGHIAGPVDHAVAQRARYIEPGPSFRIVGHGGPTSAPHATSPSV